MLFSTVAEATFIPTSSVGGSFSTLSPIFGIFRLFFSDCHSDKDDVVSHCHFELFFSEYIEHFSYACC